MVPSDTTARRTFIVLILVALALVVLTLWPFAKALFLAAVLAAALKRPQEVLTRRLGGRGSLAAGLLCLAVALLVLGPIASLVAYLVNELITGARTVAGVVQAEGVEGLLDYLPEPLRGLVQRGLQRLPVDVEELSQSVGQQLSERGGQAAKVVTGWLSATGSVLFQGVMMLIALFFLLTEGVRVVAWLEGVAPLKAGQTSDLLREFRRVTRALLVSALATAGLQALIAFLAYLVAPLPQPIFFGLVTFFTALIPAVGAAGMCLVAALVLLVGGHTWWALFLAVWGMAVVGTVDNLVKPLLARRGMSLHPAIIFFAILGGLSVFGGVGLLLGPLIVATFLALLRIYERDYGRRTPGEPLTAPSNLPPVPPGPPVRAPPPEQG